MTKSEKAKYVEVVRYIACEIVDSTDQEVDLWGNVDKYMMSLTVAVQEQAVEEIKHST